jgi:uncharacterized membrane-anchored protein YitT (DUF2179 family)
MKSKKLITDLMFLTVGCILLSVSINVFLVPYKISAGGISAIGTILLYLFGIKMSLTNLIFNIALFIFGYKYLGKGAVLKTALGIILLSAFLEITSYVPQYTENEIISVLSGGILMGAGVGMIVKIGASTGGSDFAGLILKKFLPHISLANLILIIDVVIVSISGIVFKSYTVTVYSLIALFVSSVITDKIITLGNNAKMLQIFSKENIKISNHILNQFERGVTGVCCMGMYTHEESRMLLCVITPKELPIYMNMIKDYDKEAFVIVSDVHEVIGEGFKKIY